MKDNLSIMIVAGEVSGDAHAAKLVTALLELAPDIELFGAAGRRLRDAGVETIVNADDLAVVGLPEIARALPMFVKAFRRLRTAAVKRKPDAVVLVDFPEFNLKLAKSLSRRGLKVIYYVSPQLWAWRKYRVRTIKNYVKLLLTILPFENDWYREHGVPHVEFVGNPLAREVYAKRSKTEFCADHKLDASRPILALLAGSRRKEILRILPVMLEAAARMSESDPTLQFVIPLASSSQFAEITRMVERAGANGLRLPKDLVIVNDETFDAVNAADASAVTSGTATLETAIIGTPLVVVYKTSVFNYKTMRPLIETEHFGLVNLIAGKRVVKEMIQDEFTAEDLTAELFRLLKPEENRNMRAELRRISEKLGRGGASKRAAEAILGVIRQTERQ